MFSSSGTLSNYLSVTAGIKGALAGAGQTTAFVPLADATQVSALVSTDALAAAATITVQWRQAANSAGTGAVNLGTAQVFTIPAGSTAIRSRIFDMPVSAILDTTTHVAAVVSTSAAADGAVALVKNNSRFSG